jgi:5-dehydro-2-deoxygluconokinase
VTAHLQSVLPLFDLIVGTEEEINIAGGSDDLLTSLATVRQLARRPPWW